VTDSTDEKRDAAVGELLSKSWGDLEALEFQGRVLFPGKLRRYKADGTLIEVNVLLRVPRQPDMRKARVIARQMALSSKLDLDRDKDLVEGLENLVILQEAIRNPDKPPHEPLVSDPLELEKDWDIDSLAETWSRLEALRAMLDPAPAEMTQEQTFTVLAQIASTQSISPLVVYGPSTRARFIITMASLLLSSLASKSSSESSGSSTRA
jgi:hypothetical protein